MYSLFHKKWKTIFYTLHICGLSLLLVIALLRGFFPGSLVFLPPHKPTSQNSNSTRMEDLHENQLHVKLMWLLSKYCNLLYFLLFIYWSTDLLLNFWKFTLRKQKIYCTCILHFNCFPLLKKIIKYFYLKSLVNFTESMLRQIIKYPIQSLWPSFYRIFTLL